VNSALLDLTSKGKEIALIFREKLGSDVYLPRRLLINQEKIFSLEGRLQDALGKLVENYRGIIFVSAVGIAVRAIAPHLKSKWTDPAVLVVDEEGRFVVSLLSGHWGGGNSLALEAARVIGATPVVTTASDLRGIRSPEIFARECGFSLEKPENLPWVSTALLEGEKVVYVVEEGLEDIVLRHLQCENQVLSPRISPDDQAVVFVTDRLITTPAVPHIVLRPRRLVLGVGMRRGISYQKLLSAIEAFLQKKGFALGGIGRIATVEIKRDEKALLELAENLSLPISFFSVTELREVAFRFPASRIVEQTLGVGSVARPGAFLASGGGQERGYEKGEGLSLALFQEVKKCSQ